MAEIIFTIEVSYDSTIGIVHVEGQIVCSNLHHRGNVKKGNRPMGIGKPFFKSMSVIWAI